MHQTAVSTAQFHLLLAAALACTAPALAAAQPAATRGITGTLTMTLQPPAFGGVAAGSSEITGTILLAGGKGRVDLTGARGPATDFRSGDYLLLPDSARVMYLRPATQEHWTMDSPFLSPYAQLAAMAGQITAAGGRVTMDTLGAGDSVGGFATRRFRITAEYSVGAQGMSVPAGVQIDLTVARTPMWMASAPLAGAQTFGMPVPGGMMSQIGARLAEAAADGIIVSATSTSWFVAGTTEINTVVTTRVSDLREADVEASRLEMPSGFRPGG